MIADEYGKEMTRMHNNQMGGKVLPAVPDMDTQLALSAKMIDKRTSTPKVRV